MSLPKIHKVGFECRIFQVDRRIFLCFCEWEFLCLICSEGIDVLEEYSIARHNNSKHKEKYINFIGVMRREKLAVLKRELESQENFFLRKQSVVYILLLTCWP
jgi:hypothetical protein